MRVHKSNTLGTPATTIIFCPIRPLQHSGDAVSITSPHLLLLKAFQGILQALLLSSQIVQLGLSLHGTPS